MAEKGTSRIYLALNVQNLWIWPADSSFLEGIIRDRSVIRRRDVETDNLLDRVSQQHHPDRQSVLDQGEDEFGRTGEVRSTRLGSTDNYSPLPP